MKNLTFSLLALMLLCFTTCFADTISEIAPAHSRPFLMPQAQREALLQLIEDQPWAQSELVKLKQQASDDDGYTAAFLYALLEQDDYLAIARQWLLETGENGGDLGPGRADTADDFFDHGMPWLGDVFYTTDTRHLQGYDFIYKGLSEPERTQIEKGLFASARFRKKAMDTWWQTPNLVFKPTTMVAMAGLVTQNPELIDWGFFRKPDSSLGGYFSTLNNMLKDNGPWNEAPIYAIKHLPLSKSLEMSEFLSRMTNRDWYDRTLEFGSSVRGLMDYYINTTYPGETRPDGSRVYRLLTFGDGATNLRGDTFLLSANPFQRDLGPELTQAWQASRNPGYAALLKRDGNYQPSLIDRPPLPPSPLLPDAPSSIWEDFGLAFLRSDQSAEYWDNPDAMATSLIFRQGYGHGHADALSITLFGAGKLFYPDYNPVQYENPAEGWTSSSIAHNTVVAGGANSSIPDSVQTFHEFNKDFSVIQAAVDEPLGISKKRSLAMTTEYMLDVFHVSSLIPKTWDYVLHSFARIDPGADSALYSPAGFGSRYKRISDFVSLTQNENWNVDFVYDLEAENRRSTGVIEKLANKNQSLEALQTAFGRGALDAFQPSRLRLDMAADKHTRVGHGEGPYGLAFLIARRENRKNTTFVSTHTPYYAQQQSPVNSMQTLVDTTSGSLVKVVTGAHTDFHAASHVDGDVLLTDPDSGITVRFNGYGFVRINNQSGEQTRYGNWNGYFIPAAESGQETDLAFGDAGAGASPTASAEIPPLQVNTYPELVVLKDFATSGIMISLTNLGGKPLSATVKLAANPQFKIPQHEYAFDAIPAYATRSQPITLGRYHQANGIDVLPISISVAGYDTPIQHGIRISTGPGLEQDFEHTGGPVYRIHTFGTVFDIGMRAGYFKRLMDTNGNDLYSGAALFDVSDGTTTFSPEHHNIETSFTWHNAKQASVIAEINNLVRWQAYFIQDRVYIKLDPSYTRTDTSQFVFNRNNTAFDWTRVKYLANANSAALPEPGGQDIRTQAVELPLGDSGQSLCASTQTPRIWNNNTEGLALPLNRNNDQWSLGLCTTGTLESWVH